MVEVIIIKVIKTYHIDNKRHESYNIKSYAIISMTFK